MEEYTDRIELLRSLMRAKGWDAVVITSSDPHCSEYPAPRWKQVHWLCGFSSEAADLVITLDHAGLWTDPRYFIQAEVELKGTGVELHKIKVPDEVRIPAWLSGQFGDEGIIALDGLCTSAGFASSLPGTVVSVPDLLNTMWKDRPDFPCSSIFTIETGESRESKIAWLRSVLKGKSCTGALLSSLDEIAWLLNVRGSDIEYNPLIISYLLVSEESVKWYVTKDTGPDEQSCSSFSRLEGEGIEILPYSDIDYLAEDFSGRLLIDSSSLNYSIYYALSSKGIILEDGQSPVQLRKAVKNPKEIQLCRKAHLQDGLAMEKFLYWLEKSVEAGVDISEWDAAQKLTALRSEIAEYRGDSFETISAYGPGAALPHYITPKDDAPILEAHGLYLCDSGGQYTLGTTDITRTVPLGRCSALEKEDYTLVLRAHIDLAGAVFPEGTPGSRLDVLAREPLWKHLRNFGHGTGHGVGFWLGVHEGPEEIRQNLNPVPIVPGMIISCEPGIYREGKHGVRHENLVLCVDAGTNEFAHWFRFEPLTLCHFDTSAIIPELLGSEETAWLNAYNERVYQTLSPLLPREVADWLKDKAQSI